MCVGRTVVFLSDLKKTPSTSVWLFHISSFHSFDWSPSNFSWRVDSISLTLFSCCILLRSYLCVRVCLLCVKVCFIHPIHHKPFTRPVFNLPFTGKWIWSGMKTLFGSRTGLQVSWMACGPIANNCGGAPCWLQWLTCWPWNVSLYPLFHL